MSEETKTMTLEERFAALRTLRIEANKAVADGDQATAKAKVEQLKAGVEIYNNEWKTRQFDELLATENPVLSAIKRLYIMKLSVSAKTDKATGDVKSVTMGTNAQLPGAEFRQLKMSVKDNIDLLEFDEHSKKRIFNHGQWRFWVEAFAFVMGARACEKIGNKEAAERYRRKAKLSADAMGILEEMGGRSIDGNANALAMLQRIVDAIVFIDSGKTSKEGAPLNTIKVTTNDLEFIRSIMCEETAGIDVALPNDKTMRRLVTKAIHKNVTGKAYGFIFEEEEEDVSASLPNIPGASNAEKMAMMAA